MANIALLLDEDVRPLLGEILRQRGYDVVQRHRGGQGGKRQTPINLPTLPANDGLFLRTTSVISDSWTNNTTKKVGNSFGICFPTKFRFETCSCTFL
jgi:hypothetical protein